MGCSAVPVEGQVVGSQEGSRRFRPVGGERERVERLRRAAALARYLIDLKA